MTSKYICTDVSQHYPNKCYLIYCKTFSLNGRRIKLTGLKDNMFCNIPPSVTKRNRNHNHSRLRLTIQTTIHLFRLHKTRTDHIENVSSDKMVYYFPDVDFKNPSEHIFLFLLTNTLDLHKYLNYWVDLDLHVVIKKVSMELRQFVNTQYQSLPKTFII